MQPERPSRSGAATGTPASGGPGLNLGDVSALLGLPTATIRSWNRHSSLPTGPRDEHGHRFYSDDDVAVLRQMRNHNALGVGLQAVPGSMGASPVALCQLLLAALGVLDGGEVSAVLDSSLNAYGLGVTLDEVLLPSMREVGARWARGECDAAQEQLITRSVLAWLARLADAVPSPLHERPIVLACGPQDQHTLALDAFGVMLRQERFDCHNLGAEASAASLQAAVEQSSAQAVVLVCELPRNGLAAATALQAVSHSGAALFYAGAAFRTAASREKMLGHYLGANMSRAAAYVAHQLRPG